MEEIGTATEYKEREREREGRKRKKQRFDWLVGGPRKKMAQDKGSGHMTRR